MRKYANLHGDKRVFLGAVTGIVVTDEIRDYALHQGFYFIEYTGENSFITAQTVHLKNGKNSYYNIHISLPVFFSLASNCPFFSFFSCEIPFRILLY